LGTVLVPVEQRQVALLDGSAVMAARTDSGDIYVPLRPMCATLGLSAPSQIRRIRADEVLAESLRELRIDTAGGPQTYQCLHLEAVPLWLGLVQPSKVKEHLRDRLRVYKRWMRQKVWEAFNAETGIAQAITGPDVTPDRPATDADTELAALRQVEQLGQALTTLARQQMALARRHDRAIADVRSDVEALRDRLDRAAVIMRDTIFDVTSLKTRMLPGVTISDEQAAEIAGLVRAIATEMTAREVPQAGKRRTNAYGALYDELYRRYNVSSYKLLRVEQYRDVLAWLQEHQRALGGPEAGAAP
jgi:hypothetical protein